MSSNSKLSSISDPRTTDSNANATSDPPISEVPLAKGIPASNISSSMGVSKLYLPTANSNNDLSGKNNFFKKSDSSVMDDKEASQPISSKETKTANKKDPSPVMGKNISSDLSEKPMSNNFSNSLENRNTTDDGFITKFNKTQRRSYNSTMKSASSSSNSKMIVGAGTEDGSIKSRQVINDATTVSQRANENGIVTNASAVKNRIHLILDSEKMSRTAKSQLILSLCVTHGLEFNMDKYDEMMFDPNYVATSMAPSDSDDDAVSEVSMDTDEKQKSPISPSNNKETSSSAPASIAANDDLDQYGQPWAKHRALRKQVMELSADARAKRAKEIEAERKTPANVTPASLPLQTSSKLQNFSETELILSRAANNTPSVKGRSNRAKPLENVIPTVLSQPSQSFSPRTLNGPVADSVFSFGILSSFATELKADDLHREVSFLLLNLGSALTATELLSRPELRILPGDDGSGCYIFPLTEIREPLMRYVTLTGPQRSTNGHSFKQSYYATYITTAERSMLMNFNDRPCIVQGIVGDDSEHNVRAQFLTDWMKFHTPDNSPLFIPYSILIRSGASAQEVAKDKTKSKRGKSHSSGYSACFCPRDKGVDIVKMLHLDDIIRYPPPAFINVGPFKYAFFPNLQHFKRGNQMDANLTTKGLYWVVSGLSKRVNLDEVPLMLLAAKYLNEGDITVVFGVLNGSSMSFWVGLTSSIPPPEGKLLEHYQESDNSVHITVNEYSPGSRQYLHIANEIANGKLANLSPDSSVSSLSITTSISGQSPRSYASATQGKRMPNEGKERRGPDDENSAAIKLLKTQMGNLQTEVTQMVSVVKVHSERIQEHGSQFEILKDLYIADREHNRMTFLTIQNAFLNAQASTDKTFNLMYEHLNRNSLPQVEDQHKLPPPNSNNVSVILTAPNTLCPAPSPPSRDDQLTEELARISLAQLEDFANRDSTPVRSVRDIIISLQLPLHMAELLSDQLQTPGNGTHQASATLDSGSLHSVISATTTPIMQPAATSPLKSRSGTGSSNLSQISLKELSQIDQRAQEEDRLKKIDQCRKRAEQAETTKRVREAEEIKDRRISEEKAIREAELARDRAIAEKRHEEVLIAARLAALAKKVEEDKALEDAAADQAAVDNAKEASLQQEFQDRLTKASVPPPRTTKKSSAPRGKADIKRRKPEVSTPDFTLLTQEELGNDIPLDTNHANYFANDFIIQFPSKRIAFSPEVSPGILPFISEGPSSLLVQDTNGNLTSLRGKGLFGHGTIFKKNTIVGTFEGVVQSLDEWRSSCEQGRGRYGIAIPGDRVLNCYDHQTGGSLCNTARGTFRPDGKPNRNNCKLIVCGDKVYTVTAKSINTMDHPVEFTYPYGHRDSYAAPSASMLEEAAIDSEGNITMTGRSQYSQQDMERMVQIDTGDYTDWEIDPVADPEEDEARITGLFTMDQASIIPQCCRVVAQSNNIGLRALVTEHTRDYMLAADRVANQWMTDDEQAIDDVITSRELFGSGTQLLLLHDSTALIPVDRVIGGGWCGPCSVALAEYAGSPQKSAFIVSQLNPATQVVTALAHFLISKKDSSLLYAKEHFSEAEFTKFSRFMDSYIESGCKGILTTRHDLWPHPHFLAAISSKVLVFWIEDTGVDACYLAFGNSYRTYSNLLAELVAVAPLIYDRTQIKLSGQHYEFVWPVTVDSIDVLIAFNRLADRVRAMLAYTPDEESCDDEI